MYKNYAQRLSVNKQNELNIIINIITSKKLKHFKKIENLNLKIKKRKKYQL